MSNVKISVVIPFYNTPVDFFKECIESVKKLNPFEIILVDDCPSDVELVEMAKSWGCKYYKTLTLEELILAPRAIFNTMVIKKEILIKYPLPEDANVFADVLLALCLLHNEYSYDIHKTTNYIYRKRENPTKA